MSYDPAGRCGRLFVVRHYQQYLDELPAVPRRAARSDRRPGEHLRFWRAQMFAPALKNIGVVQPRAWPFPDAGGYAGAAAQDAFCAGTTCLITKIYDQSPNHNDLTQAPRGAFSGPAMSGFDNLPIADMAPITISGHPVSRTGPWRGPDGTHAAGQPAVQVSCATEVEASPVRLRH